jgi:hypothetical protein
MVRRRLSNFKFDLTMWGPRHPRNVLLDSDCHHEPNGNNHSNNYKPHKSPCCDKPSCPGESGKRAAQSHPFQSPQEIQRPCTTTGDFSTRKVNCAPPTYDGHCPEKCYPKEVEPRSFQQADHDGRFDKGVLREIHTKSAPSGEFYRNQFRQQIADKNIPEKYGRGQNAHDYSRQYQEAENFARSRKTDYGCGKDRPEGTPFSCNDCMEPQCLHCWRKLRQAKGDFSFLDGFETKEPKVVPHLLISQGEFVSSSAS